MSIKKGKATNQGKGVTVVVKKTKKKLTKKKVIDRM